MIGTSSPGVVIALGVIAIAVLALVAKRCFSKPKRAEKWEKAEIMRQLIELSERENGKPASAPSVRLRLCGAADKPLGNAQLESPREDQSAQPLEGPRTTHIRHSARPGLLNSLFESTIRIPGS